jgi:hypothetical protein
LALEAASKYLPLSAVECSTYVGSTTSSSIFYILLNSPGCGGLAWNLELFYISSILEHGKLEGTRNGHKWPGYIVG